MIQTIPAAQRRGTPPMSPFLFGLALLLIGFYFYTSTRQAHEVLRQATAATTSGLTFSYKVVHDHMTVDWSGGGDFDPRGKCPKDFFSAGFIVLCKKLQDGSSVKFLYHQGKRLLYRIDQELIAGKLMYGLHWVVNTKFNSKYRIADQAFKGGRTTSVPTATGGRQPQRFTYGEVVSKKRVRPDRELFRQTHIRAGECDSWRDIFGFHP